jgi:4-amino-4-deoxy-L-arabinose transferase-like glycosyltransferase
MYMRFSSDDDRQEIEAVSVGVFESIIAGVTWGFLYQLEWLNHDRKFFNLAIAIYAIFLALLAIFIFLDAYINGMPYWLIGLPAAAWFVTGVLLSQDTLFGRSNPMK